MQRSAKNNNGKFVENLWFSNVFTLRTPDIRQAPNPYLMTFLLLLSDQSNLTFCPFVNFGLEFE